MATGDALVPRLQRVPIVRTSQRVTDAVRRTPAADIIVPYPTPFGSIGPLDTTTSHPFPLPFGFTLDGACACLSAGLTGSTVLTFYLDGSSAFTLTIPSGSTAPVEILGQATGTYHQKLTIAATTLGTGTALLGGHLRWTALP